MTPKTSGSILAAALMTGVWAGAAVAQEAPRVAVDVAPLHGLVTRVMQDVGTPGLVLRQGASPHGYALRPSEARLLQEADLVFRIGEGLTPWLEGSLATLASGAEVVTVMDLPGVTVHAFREGMAFEEHAEGHEHDKHEHEDHGHADHGHDDHEQDDHGHEAHAKKEHAHDEHGHKDHGHGEHGHDGHGHEEGHNHAGHDEHGHEEHAHEGHEHEDHGHKDHGHEGHDHSGTDPHAWMDPTNAVIWTRAIADHLAEADPDNAAAYQANAEAAVAELEALSEEITAQLAPYEKAGFVVFHDAYQYFETAFGLKASGAISLSDARAPGAARLAAIQEGIAEHGIVCVFSEPQFNANVVRTVVQGTGARMAVLDPMGAELGLGPEFYPALMRAMAGAMAGCFAGDG